MPGVDQQHAVIHDLLPVAVDGLLILERELGQVQHFPFQFMIVFRPGGVLRGISRGLHLGKLQLVFNINLLVMLLHRSLCFIIGLGNGILLRLDDQGIDQEADNSQHGKQDRDNQDDRDSLALLCSTHFMCPPFSNSE